MPKDLGRLLLALVAGAAVAFPAGMMFAERNGRAEQAAPSRNAGTASGHRNAFSPNVTSDPHVLDEQRKVVEALERQCRQSGENCAEATQARHWIDEASD